jgi:hypothetical protein
MPPPTFVQKDGIWQPQGYPKLAQLFERYPSTAIFRRFGFLNMMSLLSLQAELMGLERRLKEACRDADFAEGGDTNELTRSFEKLEESRMSPTKEVRLLVQTMDEVQCKTRAYSKLYPAR